MGWPKGRPRKPKGPVATDKSVVQGSGANSQEHSQVLLRVTRPFYHRHEIMRKGHEFKTKDLRWAKDLISRKWVEYVK